MDVAEMARRLDAQDRLLHAIVAALAPEPTEAEGSGFEDPIEVLADLTEAVADVTQAMGALRSDGCARCRAGGGDPASPARALDPRLDACLAAAERARAAVARLEEEALYERERAWALWGLTDIWGLPLR